MIGPAMNVLFFILSAVGIEWGRGEHNNCNNKRVSLVHTWSELMFFSLRDKDNNMI